MSKSLVIVESPAKAKTISRFLGDDYTVEASVGHIRDLIQPKNVKTDKRFSASIHIENPTLLKFGIESNSDSLSDPMVKELRQQLGTKSWVPWYVESLKSQKTITQLKRALKKADALYLATDEDREGEAIAWHLKEILKLNEEEYERIVFREITKKAVLNSIENPTKINMDLVNAQQARRVLDRLVGFEISPILWKKIKRGLSAGRVQSVAVKFVVDSCLLYTSPSPRDVEETRMPSSA